MLWGTLLPGWQVRAGTGGGGSLLGRVAAASYPRSLVLAESGAAGSPAQHSCPRPGQHPHVQEPVAPRSTPVSGEPSACTFPAWRPLRLPVPPGKGFRAALAVTVAGGRGCPGLGSVWLSLPPAPSPTPWRPGQVNNFKCPVSSFVKWGCQQNAELSLWRWPFKKPEGTQQTEISPKTPDSP